MTPGTRPSDITKRPAGVRLAAGQQEHEGCEGRQQHSADDSDGDICVVEPMQRDRDHEGDPEHAVEHHGRSDALGCEGETGIGPVHAVRGEQPVTEPGAARGPAWEHVADREGGQIDAEHLGERRTAFRQHRLGEAPVGGQGSGLEGESGQEPDGVDPAQLTERGTCLGVQEAWDEDVLDDHEEDEECQPVTQRARDPPEKAAPTARRLLTPAGKPSCSGGSAISSMLAGATS